MTTGSFARQRVTVMGLGRFGGGLGAARFLATQGATVTITDRKPEADFAEVIPELKPLIDAGRVRLALGGHVETDFTETDLVVANPAVPTPWQNPYLLSAERAGVPITTEVALLIERLPAGAVTIGITGSVGKSTTTAMIDHALRACGVPCVLGGNIGGSLLERLPLTEGDAVVLELSSAMLYWLGRVGTWAPRIAVCTNLSPNHADWHGSHEHYTQSKQQLLKHQTARDFAVLGPTLGEWSSLTKGTVTHVGGPLGVPLAIPGAHNRLNAAVALAAVRLAVQASGKSVSDAQITAALAGFPGLEHRLALAHASGAGVRFYNDSKCTTVAACKQALSALAEEHSAATSHIHLIVGGDAKQQDVSAIAALAPSLAGLYAIGRDRGAFVSGESPTGNTLATEHLRDAIAAAIARVQPGHIVLLSPACASWDQYPNYEHRGHAFTTLAKQLAP